MTPGPLHRWIDRTAAALTAVGDGHDIDYAAPAGEPALVAPDSVSWQVFRNPLTVLIGGIAAVLLELAEARVRTGIDEHSHFRADPLRRLRRTGRATMMTVYGPRAEVEAMIGHVDVMHRRVEGVTPDGRPYRASTPELLAWVHATASHGFLQARHRYAAAISNADQDRFYAEGRTSARLYGAEGVPTSRAAMARYLDDWQGALEPSAQITEFLRVMSGMPLVSRALSPVQGWLVRAAVPLLPPGTRERLGLGARWSLGATETAVVRALVRHVDRHPLLLGPPVQACRRLGLPDDYLWRSARG